MGFIQWVKFYDQLPYRGDCKQVVGTVDGGYAFTGGWDSTGNRSLFVRLLKTDSLGNELWHNSYGFNDADDGYGLQQTSDSGFVIIGIRFGFNWDDIYIIKTDKFGNTSPYIGIRPTSEELPVEYKLYQNYPNPLNSRTVIKYQIPQSGYVELTLYDVLGREAKVLVREFQEKGLHQATLNAGNLSSGLYFYKIVAEKFSDSRKLIVIK